MTRNVQGEDQPLDLGETSLSRLTATGAIRSVRYCVRKGVVVADVLLLLLLLRCGTAVVSGSVSNLQRWRRHERCLEMRRHC